MACKHEVFISFRGSDVRVNFLSHFLKSLFEEGIDVLVDEELERGEEISKSILEIIEGSSISVVIFSENYAFSPWCLDELMKILDCKKTMGQIVIPVFYCVEASHVQQLRGSFGDAIAIHRKNFKDSLSMVENWCQALIETSLLSGFVSFNYKSDSALIEEIMRHILEKLNNLYLSDDSYYDDGLVGIDSRIKNVKSLLCGEDVRIVGIWGMGGIGKTTIAEKVSDQICSQFESHCFVGNVREKFEKNPDIVRNEILSKLLPTNFFDVGNSNLVRRRLSRKKVMIVLDDVIDYDQVKAITGKLVDYGSGSRIIVTSRDKQLLKNMNAKIYEVEKLNECEALQLFSLNAFKQNIPEEGFVELSKSVVEYAQGLPLALEVLGCNLHGKSVEEWRDELEYLKGKCEKKIHKILRRSYDGLSKDEKEIFLDIASFFRWKRRDYVESIINVPGSKIGISRLVDKSLVSISPENCLQMHDLIQQMAKEIVCEEQMLKKRSRLWNPDEIYYLLAKEKGTNAVKGISLDMSKIKDINLCPKAFERMYNLRYLILYDSYTTDIRVYLDEGFEFLSEELRYLCWYQYPSKSLPLSFCAEKLVKLDMPNGNLEQLWNGVQNLANLKWIDLSFSKKLIKIPDLSRALNLKFLLLSWCTSLVEIPDSIKYLSKLSVVHLHGCLSLSRLPSSLHLISLKFLGLSGCSKLAMFPNIPCYLRYMQLCDLYLDGCLSLEQLPDSISNMINLRVLCIEGCLNLRKLPENLGNLKFLKKMIVNGSGINSLPDSICNLKNLQCIDVNDCAHLHRLPQNLGNLESLKELIANGSGIKEVPSSINDLRELRVLNLNNCEGLVLPPLTGDFPRLERIYLNSCGISEFPNSLCSITSLQKLYLGGNYFASIPESIKQLSGLEKLDLRDCKRLKYLPELPCRPLLYASNCKYMKSVPGLRNDGISDFQKCIKLEQNECNRTLDNVLATPGSWVKVQNIGKRVWLFTPGSEVLQKMMYQNKSGSSLCFSFKLLEQRDCVWFYLCGVLDSKLSEFSEGEVNIKCHVLLIDEFGGCINRKKSKIEYKGDVHPKHVFLQLDYLSNNFVKDNMYRILLEFYATEIEISLRERCSQHRIIECGFHPIFDHEFID